MAGAVVLENGLKYALHRARPEPYFAAAPETFSFPSGHALFSACFYVTLAWIFATRIRNGDARGNLDGIARADCCHRPISQLSWCPYPTDVLAGYLVSAFWITGLLASRSGPDAGMSGLHVQSV
jgi:undecaprenyl-diphosphatase